MDVPFVDLKRQYTPLLPEIKDTMDSIIERCAFINGPEVREFEQKMAKWLGVPWVCGVSNGTHALYLTLKALGIGKGDEVITVANTAFPTSEAINSSGADVVFVDISQDYFSIDPEAVRSAVTARTRAVIPVHLYGIPAEMEAITEIAEKHDLLIVEDVAQAMGAMYKGKKVGTIGVAGCFSFFPSKNLGAFGDGGAVASADKELAQRVRMLSNHGREEKYIHLLLGTNSRLDTLKAGQLSICLDHLDEWNQERRQAAALYEELLGPFEEIRTPAVPEGCEAVWHLYVIRYEKRDDLAAFLRQKGIRTGLHYPLPLHKQPAYADLGLKEGSLPRAEKACREVLSLPMFPKITPAEIETVAKAIGEFLSHQGKA